MTLPASPREVAAAATAVAREGWLEEQRSAYLYRILARKESNRVRAEAFATLAQAAEKQSKIWANALREAGAAEPAAYEPDLRTRVVAALVRGIGPYAMQGVLAAMKVRGMSMYGNRATDHPTPTNVEDIGRGHPGLRSGGALRAAVFGVNDGLISNASLILGVAGANVEPNFILLSGMAGLLAGAFSMAAGEYVSVRSQREMFEHQIELERQELELYPEEEAQELSVIYRARGLSAQDADALAQRITRSPEHALDALAREELGLDPDGLGSPWEAAVSSLLAFAFGAVIPLLPFLFARQGYTVALSALLAAVALFGVGAALSLFTGRGAWWSGARMLAIGALSGGCAYAIGKLLGVSLA